MEVVNIKDFKREGRKRAIKRQLLLLYRLLLEVLQPWLRL